MIDDKIVEWLNYWESKDDSDPYKKIDHTKSTWYYRFIFLEKLFKSQDFRNKLVLDIGCGVGFYTDYLIKKWNAKVFSLDLAKRMLLSVNKRAYRIQGALPCLPFKEAKFDYVLCVEVFQYIPDLMDSLVEINRVLKTGGILYFTTLNSDFIISKLRSGKNFKLNLIKRNRHELEYLLKKAGFEPVVEHIPVLPFMIPGFSMDLLGVIQRVGTLCNSVGGYAIKIE